MQIKVTFDSRLANRWAERFSQQRFTHAVRVLAPTLLALSITTVAHAQGTMDFSGAQTLMGTFKPTLLTVLADAIPERERILIIEDTAELSIRKPHAISAKFQTDTHRSQLILDHPLKAILRHRPDRIIVGRVRGPAEGLHRLASLAIRAGSNVGNGAH